MTGLDLAFDAMVAIALPVVAWRAIASRELTHAVVLFVALGLLTAVAWARLGAFDVALVEAAVGAGLTGALLMSTIPWAGASVRWSGPRPTRVATAGAALAAIGVAAVLGVALLALPTEGSPLGAAVARATPDSAAVHPVTAVLLDFRGYDTLLEVAVLVVSALGAQALHAGGGPRHAPPIDARRAVLLAAVADLLVPASVVVAGYLVWKGATSPGGAFQASAVLAGAGILQLFRRRAAPARRGVGQRAALLAGLALFALLALAPLAAGGALLDHPDRYAAALIVALEVTLAVSLGLALVLFHPASAPDATPGRAR